MNAMAYIEFNPNPVGRKVGDCAVRAIAKALNMGWEAAYIALVMNGMQMGDVMTGNSVIGATLRQHGFKKFNIPNTCPDCYTVEDFAEDHPSGVYVAGTGSHVVAIKDGSYFDAWDSGKEPVAYAWYREESEE